MDWEVVDGLVGGNGHAWGEAGFGEHGEDGASVRGRERFSLEVGDG